MRNNPIKVNVCISKAWIKFREFYTRWIAISFVAIQIGCDSSFSHTPQQCVKSIFLMIYVLFSCLEMVTGFMHTQCNALLISNKPNSFAKYALMLDDTSE